MDKKKVISVAIAMLVVLAISAAIPVQAETPPSPGSIYIQDVLVGNPNNPLDYDSGGARILLTQTGDDVGKYWNGAMALAYFTIESWESQTEESWTYQWRSQESVANEILWHCWCPWIDTTTRYTTISFDDGWMWD